MIIISLLVFIPIAFMLWACCKVASDCDDEIEREMRNGFMDKKPR